MYIAIITPLSPTVHLQHRRSRKSQVPLHTTVSANLLLLMSSEWHMNLRTQISLTYSRNRCLGDNIETTLSVRYYMILCHQAQRWLNRTNGFLLPMKVSPVWMLDPTKSVMITYYRLNQVRSSLYNSRGLNKVCVDPPLVRLTDGPSGRNCMS